MSYGQLNFQDRPNSLNHILQTGHFTFTAILRMVLIFEKYLVRKILSDSIQQKLRSGYSGKNVTAVPPVGRFPLNIGRHQLRLRCN